VVAQEVGSMTAVEKSLQRLLLVGTSQLHSSGDAVGAASIDPDSQVSLSAKALVGSGSIDSKKTPHRAWFQATIHLRIASWKSMYWLSSQDSKNR
jgi:hypothetical protein